MKKVVGLLFALLLVSMLPACGMLGSGTSMNAPQSAEQIVYNIDASYTAGILVPMAAYEGLPRCDVTTSKVCSTQSVVDQMRKADSAYNSAIRSAETLVRNFKEVSAASAIEAAFQAAQAVQDILLTYGVIKAPAVSRDSPA